MAAHLTPFPLPLPSHVVLVADGNECRKYPVDKDEDEDCPTFITPTFITSDIHHPLTEFRHSSPWTFITPYLK